MNRKNHKNIGLKKTGKLLHILYPVEFGNFLMYLKTAAEETADDSDELARVWGKQVLAVGFWITLARETLTLLHSYEISAPQYKGLFIGYLFKSEQYLFTLYYLKQYTRQPESSETFALAVRLLFNTEQFAED